jgi:hypothetical protein
MHFSREIIPPGNIANIIGDPSKCLLRAQICPGGALQVRRYNFF